MLVSMEEEPDVQRERPFYQALDDLSEGMIRLREIIVEEPPSLVAGSIR